MGPPLKRTRPRLGDAGRPISGSGYCCIRVRLFHLKFLNVDLIWAGMLWSSYEHEVFSFVMHSCSIELFVSYYILLFSLGRTSTIFSSYSCCLAKMFFISNGCSKNLGVALGTHLFVKVPRPGDLQYIRFRSSIICQGTSTRRQRNDLFGLRVKLPSISTSLTTQRQSR